jgi:hypothetical protein
MSLIWLVLYNGERMTDHLIEGLSSAILPALLLQLTREQIRTSFNSEGSHPHISASFPFLSS